MTRCAWFAHLATSIATSTSTSTWPSVSLPQATRIRFSPRSSRKRVANGTCYTFPVEDSIILAEEIKRRFGCDLVRFSQLRAPKRRWTRSASPVASPAARSSLKFEGGYHGHHDDVLVSIQPPREFIGPADAPDDRARVRWPAALARRGDGRRAVQQPRGARPRSSSRIESEIAAIIIEPVQFNIGVVPPLPGFLERVRELATEHGAVLIFDEVKTGVVLAYGGATEWFGVKPDLFCLAKSIGGGVPIGAFGGRGDIMGVIEKLPDSRVGDAGTALAHSTIPGGATRVAHLGTFNGNPLSMAAGVTVLTQILTRDVYPRSCRPWATDSPPAARQIIDEFGLPGYAVNVGPKGCVMFTPSRVTNYRDFIGLDSELWAASFFFLVNRGVLLPPGPDDQWTLSVQHTDEDIDRYISTFRTSPAN